jgi:hypothetical protein
MCSHTDGSLTTWTVRQAPKPINVSQPHGKYTSVMILLHDGGLIASSRLSDVSANIVSGHVLGQCFPTRIPQKPLRGFARNRRIKNQNFKVSPKFQISHDISREFLFCHWQCWSNLLTLRTDCFVLFSSYLRLYLAVLCLCFFVLLQSRASPVHCGSNYKKAGQNSDCYWKHTVFLFLNCFHKKHLKI